VKWWASAKPLSWWGGNYTPQMEWWGAATAAPPGRPAAVGSFRAFGPIL
jgi:hypothetical protein